MAPSGTLDRTLLLRVNRASLRLSSGLPVYPRLRTCRGTAPTDAMGHKPTSAWLSLLAPFSLIAGEPQTSVRSQQLRARLARCW